MIDIKDLMSGNFYEINGEIQRVYCYEQKAGLIYFNSDGTARACDPKQANPVPIAADWLEEVCIGGEQISKRLKFIQWLPKECNCIITIYSKPGGLFLVALYSIVDDNISYFKGEKLLMYRHELQNFFRIHTGKDLI